MNAAEAQAHMCAYLIARLMDLPREEFGAQHALAVDAAYGTVRALLGQELRLAATGAVRGEER